MNVSFTVAQMGFVHDPHNVGPLCLGRRVLILDVHPPAEATQVLRVPSFFRGMSEPQRGWPSQTPSPFRDSDLFSLGSTQTPGNSFPFLIPVPPTPGITLPRSLSHTAVSQARGPFNVKRP